MLFLMYIGYVTIMFFNEKLETFFTAVQDGEEREGATTRSPKPSRRARAAPTAPRRRAAAAAATTTTTSGKTPGRCPTRSRPACSGSCPAAERDAVRHAAGRRAAGRRQARADCAVDAGGRGLLHRHLRLSAVAHRLQPPHGRLVTIIGAVFGISDYIMGLTIPASGTSIPDVLSSMYMAKEGRGDMAISSPSARTSSTSSSACPCRRSSSTSWSRPRATTSTGSRAGTSTRRASSSTRSSC